MKKIMAYFVVGILVFVGGALYLFAQSQDTEKSKPIWCTPPAATGDNKAKIENEWGKPDTVKDLGFDEAGLKKEEWVYYSKPFAILSQNSYVCATQRLVFVGDNLVKIYSSEETAEK